MKKVLFLLLVTSISYGQALFDKGIKITGGITTDNSALKVVVQSSNNVLNTIAKNDLIDVVIVNTTAELTSGIGNVSKLYATRDNTIIYRYNGTIYVPLGGDISSKEDIANKQNSLAVDGTNLKYPTVTATNAGLDLKANLASPTFTGTVVLPSTTSIGNVSSTELGYVDGVTSSIQSQFTAKANLASPTFTGVPIVPTASNGTNTGQAASTAFVTGAITTADSGNVKLTGNQTIAGNKGFTGFTSFNRTYLGDYISWSNLNSLNNISSYGGGAIGTISGNFAIASNNKPAGSISTDNVGLTINPVLQFPNTSGTIALTNNPTSLTATSFINSTAPATNALLANGTTLANPISGSGTTGYLPKFTSAGVIGNSSVIQDVNGNISVMGGSGADVLYLEKATGASIGLSGSTGTVNKVIIVASSSTNPDLQLYTGGAIRQTITSSGETSFTGKLKATCPIYANDAAADADATLLSGQFYKLTGSRAVYQKP